MGGLALLGLTAGLFTMKHRKKAVRENTAAPALTKFKDPSEPSYEWRYAEMNTAVPLNQLAQRPWVPELQGVQRQ